MKIDFYYTPGSTPARAVYLTIKALDLDDNINIKEMNLMKGDQYTPEFTKLNPQNLIPVINDNGFVLSESRAIMAYLADKFGKDDSLYPKDLQKRAIVNQRLYFDMGTLFQRFTDCYYPVMFAGVSLDKGKQKKLEEALGYLEKYLEGTQYAVGDHITIADLSLAATISTIEAVGLNFSKYRNVTKYFHNLKSSLKGYDEANQKGADIFKRMHEQFTKKK